MCQLIRNNLACEKEKDKKRNQNSGQSKRRPQHHFTSRCGQRPLGMWKRVAHAKGHMLTVS